MCVEHLSLIIFDQWSFIYGYHAFKLVFLGIVLDNYISCSVHIPARHAYILAYKMSHRVLIIHSQLAMVDNLDLCDLARTSTQRKKTIQRHLLGGTQSGSLSKQGLIKRSVLSLTTFGERLTMCTLLEYALVKSLLFDSEFALQIF